MSSLFKPDAAMRVILTVFLIGLNCESKSPHGEQKSGYGEIRLSYPILSSGNTNLDKAFRIALGDLVTNIQEYKIELTGEDKPVILAGLDYRRPWTRDAAINAWNSVSLIAPEIARNTLLSVLKKDDQGITVGGQYWDAIVWCSGAWHHYLVTADKEFLKTAYEATRNTLKFYEITEYNSDFGLFRGLGWSDGVAAYPDKYANIKGESAAWKWPEYNQNKKSVPGYGIPMMAISTNCLYYNAYQVIQKMEEELGMPPDKNWQDKAMRLKTAINRHLWNPESGVYRFYVDEEGPCDLQETLGNAYAILFDVADDKQKSQILDNQYVAPAGVPCGWPTLSRYDAPDGMSFGRHNATVWPQIQGFWAQAAADAKFPNIFGHELFNLADHAVRDKQFAEIYHPITGEIYGGLQESRSGIRLWNATNRQSWAASAFMRMIIFGLFGLKVDDTMISIQPCVPSPLKAIKLSNLQIRDLRLTIEISGSGTEIQEVLVNNVSQENTLIAADAGGSYSVMITMAEI